jgi:hypothetical protein
MSAEAAVEGKKRRGKRIVLISLGVLAFLVISFLLARFLQVENIERDDELALVEAETKGSATGMLAQLSGCRRSVTCMAHVKADASNVRLRRTGAVKILQLESPTAYSLTGSTGKTRLAWTVLPKLPIVQCVEVRRTGNAVTGINLTLIEVSTPIQNEADC